jgi:hypothetical protein
MSAINHSTGIPMDSRREVLMGYQYALHQHKKKLLEEKSELRRSQENNNTSSRSLWEEYSETSESSEERHRQPKHNRRRTEWPNKEDITKSINLMVPRPGHAPMVLKAQIGGYDIGRVFMDADSGINLIYARTLKAMNISLDW